MVRFNIDCANCTNREVCKYMDNMGNIQNDVNMLINSITIESDNLQLTLSCKYHRTDAVIRGINDIIDRGEICSTHQSGTGVKYYNPPSSHCDVSESKTAIGECSVAPVERAYNSNIEECSVTPAERLYDSNSDIERSSNKISAGDFLTNIINTCKEAR